MTAASATAFEPPPTDGIGRFWWVGLVSGILTILVGVVALAFPKPTLLLVGVLLGVYLVLSGVMLLVDGIGDNPSAGLRIVAVLIGVASVLVGVALIFRPDESVLTAAWLLGFWWLFKGVMHLVAAAVVPQGRGWQILAGVIGIVGGAIVLAYPDIGVVTLLLIVGTGLILQGVLQTIAGFKIRSLHKAGAL